MLRVVIVICFFNLLGKGEVTGLEKACLVFALPYIGLIAFLGDI
jgi:hypothetical protein